MIHYTCDICGTELPGSYRRQERQKKLAGLCGVKDVCQECEQKGEAVDVAGVLLAAWRSAGPPEAPDQKPEELRERDHPIPPPGFSGRGGGEKARILELLKAFRKEKGLGCLAAVAELAGPDVTDDLLREMLIGGTSPGIVVWRRIEKALDKLEGGHE